MPILNSDALAEIERKIARWRERYTDQLKPIRTAEDLLDLIEAEDE